MSRSNSPKRRKGIPSHNPKPQGRCPSSGKIRWATRADARWHLRALRGQGKRKNRTLGAYKCPLCDAWHVGHKASRYSRSTEGATQ